MVFDNSTNVSNSLQKCQPDEDWILPEKISKAFPVYLKSNQSVIGAILHVSRSLLNSNPLSLM